MGNLKFFKITVATKKKPHCFETVANEYVPNTVYDQIWTIVIGRVFVEYSNVHLAKYICIGKSHISRSRICRPCFVYKWILFFYFHIKSRRRLRVPATNTSLHVNTKWKGLGYDLFAICICTRTVDVRRRNRILKSETSYAIFFLKCVQQCYMEKHTFERTLIIDEFVQRSKKKERIHNVESDHIVYISIIQISLF